MKKKWFKNKQSWKLQIVYPTGGQFSRYSESWPWPAGAWVEGADRVRSLHCRISARCTLPEETSCTPVLPRCCHITQNAPAKLREEWIRFQSNSLLPLIESQLVLGCYIVRQRLNSKEVKAPSSDRIATKHGELQQLSENAYVNLCQAWLSVCIRQGSSRKLQFRVDSNVVRGGFLLC